MADEIPIIINRLKELDTRDKADEYVKEMKDEFPKVLSRLSDENWTEIEKLLCSCLEHGYDEILDAIAIPILDIKKLIDWKKHHTMIDNICEALTMGAITDAEYRKYYNNFTEKLMKLLKINKLMKDKKGKLLEIMKLSLRTSDPELQIHHVAQSIAGEYIWKNEQHDVIIEMFELVANCVYDNPTLSGKSFKYYASWMVLIKNFQEGSAKLFVKMKDIIAKMFNFCYDQEWQDLEDPEENTISYKFLAEIMQSCLYTNHQQTELLKPCMDTVKKLWDCGDETLERDANNIMTGVADNPELSGDQTDTLLDRYFSGEEPTLIATFTQLYPKAKEKFYGRFDDLIESMDGAQDWVQLSTLNILMQIAKDNAEVFTPAGILATVRTLDGDNSVHLAFQVLSPLAEKLPADIISYDDKIIDAIQRLKGMGTSGIPILVALSKRSEDKARKYMKVLVDMLQILENVYKTSVLFYMRSIGQEWSETLAEHRPLLEKLTEDTSLRDSANACIDVLEGRSLGTMAAEVKETRDDVDKLEERVDSTEENVENLGRQVDTNTTNINEVKTTVNEQGERLDDIEEVVEETVEKVEELDHKTLSHAPMWARDVAEILNPEGEHDWRLLATRLGYTNDDIRNWATQANSCLSMFDEWFATHKTREATFGILKQLQEMNQLQAAMIVENALKAAEGVVEDEKEEYVEPPAIFISYQWGHQDEVKLLKQHLEMAGYEAWMDIGQMGGGDKLFQKIDQGIRAAKVVISCVTQKYAKSPNCNREVNLSVNLGKPIIPLLMESVSWPPPGAMDPIFGEYLYIKFFKDNEDAENTYWPKQQFQELLMQLRYSVVPNMELVKDEYKGWTEPPEEIILIKQKEKKGESRPGTITQNGEEANEKMPEVFISYQWGKQPEIKELYRKLTSLGLRCWLDIMQMGGGDSLYDKIDKGIRNSRVVLSCVTSKYSLSANCRREVSLADALKKPIIPLLLEQITWPPEGPMAMVFTQLLYIDFCSDSSTQEVWNVPQFDEMLGKVKANLPADVLENEPTTETSNTETDKAEADDSRTESEQQERSPSVTTDTEAKIETRSAAVSTPPLVSVTPSAQRRTSAPLVSPKSSCCIIQ